MLKTNRNNEIKIIIKQGYKLADRASDLTALQLFYLDIYELEMAIPVDQKPGFTFTPDMGADSFNDYVKTLMRRK